VGLAAFEAAAYEEAAVESFLVGVAVAGSLAAVVDPVGNLLAFVVPVPKTALLLLEGPADNSGPIHRALHLDLHQAGYRDQVALTSGAEEHLATGANSA
jgi:hypothetical protein